MPAPRLYDFIGFGDEVPGILALVAAAREHRRQTGSYPRSLLVFKGNEQLGIGGHLVRGRLSYLDRSHVPFNIRQSFGLGSFGDAPSLYKEFLRRADVDQIALDPRRADVVLRQMLSEANVDTLGGVEIASVVRDGDRLAGINLTKGEIYLGTQFIDATVNAELAQFAGVRKLKGFETFGLPNSELSVTLTFETEGLSISRLQAIESIYLQRFANPADQEAQGWLEAATGNDAALAQQLRQDLRDSLGNLKGLWAGNDYADVRSKALSLAYHAFRGTKLSLSESGAILDNANIAVFPGNRLSWNALLFDVNADDAEALARASAQPTAAMLKEMRFVQQWFKSLGATAVTPAPELYIRHAGNVADVVEPLSGAQMLAGGVPETEALGTFGYAFDVRGGIAGIGEVASQQGISSLRFQEPLFNVGIRHAIARSVPNLAIVSPASGFTGFAASAGRIVEFNVAVGQGVGIACSLAALSDRTLVDVANEEVHQVLAQTGRLSRIYGQGRPEAQLLAMAEQQLGDTTLTIASAEIPSDSTSNSTTIAPESMERRMVRSSGRTTNDRRAPTLQNVVS
jgi:FAD dependent oxidoreductase